VGAEPGCCRCPFLARRFADEAGLRRRVETAERLGIPPSQLDGREPAEVTEYEYDEQGRLVRSVTTREPRYTEQDRAELLALAIYREGLCPRCGRPLDVCTAPEDGGPEYVVTWRTCGATRALLEHQRAAYGGKDHVNRAAHLWGTAIRKR
jgi:YD repeat-containing protein